MRPSRIRLSSREPLLANFQILDQESRVVILFEKHQNTVIIFIILVTCAPFSFVLSIMFLQCYESNATAATREAGLQLWFPENVHRQNRTSISNESQSVTVVTTADVSTQTSACKPRIVGYYIDPDNLKVSDNQLRKLTHIVFQFVNIDSSGALTFKGNNTENKIIEVRKRAKMLNPELKFMIGIGQWDYSDPHKRQYMFPISDPDKLKTILDSIAIFLYQHRLDGLDLYWRYYYGSRSLLHYKFIQDLRSQLTTLGARRGRKKHYILSLVTSNSVPLNIYRHYLNQVVLQVDFVNVVFYNVPQHIDGKFSQFIGPMSPLYGGKIGNVDERMRHFICGIKNPEKLNMAVMFHGILWYNASYPFNSIDDIWVSTDLNTTAHQVLWRNFKSEGWKEKDLSWHEKSKSSYLWNAERKTFMGLETERSLREKMIYANEKNIGGVSIWAMDYDDDEDSLLNVVASEKKCTTEEQKYKEDYICYDSNSEKKNEKTSFGTRDFIQFAAMPLVL